MARTKMGECCSGGCSRPSCKRAKPISGDCQDGYGKKNFAGDIYEGHFKDGLPHGEGSWTCQHSTTSGTFERGTMVTGTVTISTKTTDYDREIYSLEKKIAALKEKLAVTVKRAEANRISDGASWTGTWVSNERGQVCGKPHGMGVWRLRDGREAYGACPSQEFGYPRQMVYDGDRWYVPYWVPETATAVAVPGHRQTVAPVPHDRDHEGW